MLLTQHCRGATPHYKCNTVGVSFSATGATL